MIFSERIHFSAQEDCEHCHGSGHVDTLQGIFNPKDMDFDIITDVLCPYCLDQSKEDFQSYMEDNV